MVFSSIEFIWLFMPVVLALYLALPPRWRNALLAAASIGFYVWGARSVVFLFLGSILLNYVLGRLIGRAKETADAQRVKTVTAVGVALNLAILFFWKYAVFAVEQLNSVLGVFGDSELGVPAIALPIGISFFTFHGISYLVDIERGRARPMRSIADYAQYMAFFPQLIAGPIIRYHEIDDQIRHPPPRSERIQNIADGFPRFALGLSKKVLIADPAGAVANAAFAVDGDLSTPTAWLGALAYTVQIYFDFSGYSDMAIGMARMFGFRFPENFKRPYSAVSITDFWRRWHMTLSRWFRDYVYIPLGGNRGTQAETVRNLLFVFFLTGAWHGAAWTFVLWGLLQGVLIVAERLTGVAQLAEDRWSIQRRAITFLLVVFSWVLFRADGPGEAARFYEAMISFDFAGGLDPAVDLVASADTLIAIALGLATVLLPREFVLGRVLQNGWDGAPLGARIAVIAVLPWAAITVAAGSFSPFLYFRF